MENAYLVIAAQPIIADFLQTFIEFPPRQKATTFTIDQAIDKLNAALAGGG